LFRNAQLSIINQHIYGKKKYIYCHIDNKGTNRLICSAASPRASFAISGAIRNGWLKDDGPLFREKLALLAGNREIGKPQLEVF
jgi:hypothetical protein